MSDRIRELEARIADLELLVDHLIAPEIPPLGPLGKEASYRVAARASDARVAQAARHARKIAGLDAANDEEEDPS